MRKPNIVFILLDDLGWRDLTCFGSSFYETPNLDQLSRQGMVFTDAYAAAPVCSPSRASLMTGRYPARVGVTDYIDSEKHIHPARGRLIDAPYIDHLPLGEFNLARALKESGYAAWHIGKWHLGGDGYEPQHQGFDVNIGGGHFGYPWRGYFSPWELPYLRAGDEDEYLTDRLTDEAIRLIRENRGGPFFLNLWHYAVHNPIQAKPEDADRFRRKAARLRLDQIDPFVEGEPFPTEHKKHLNVVRRTVQSNPDYAGMIYNLDWNIGRLVAALKECGQWEHTLFIFTSDNGGLATSEGSPTCNAPLAEGKGWMYEGGNRVPLFFVWPGVIPAGTTCRTPFSSPDLYPTVLEMAGLPAKPDQHLDGASFAPILRAEGQLDDHPVFWHYPHYGNQGGTPSCAVRLGYYKLIEFYEDGRLELYHLGEDISEVHDIASNHPDLVRYLRGKLRAWRSGAGAILPEINPDWDSMLK
jgi:arylsulfatase A-like enzyme